MSMTKNISFLLFAVTLLSLYSCKNEFSTPPRITYIAPQDTTNKSFFINTPIALKASLYDKTGLASLKVKIYSNWKKSAVFLDSEQNLNGVEAFELDNTFVIDTLINYPKATYIIDLQVTDVDGNLAKRSEIISLKP